MITEKGEPGLAVLALFASQNVTWTKAFAEWIDNSLDKLAHLVSFEFLSGGLIITDDGRGCDTPIKMVQIGGHYAGAIKPKMGRFGAGGKIAALWACGVDSTYSATTVSKGQRLEIDVYWPEFAANDWTVQRPDPTHAKPGEHGTTIRVGPVRRRLSKGDAWNQILDELGYLFGFAINSGCQIRFKNGREWEVLRPWTMPLFNGEPLVTTIRVGEREARVRCGIVEAGHPNKRPGFTYVNEWRVVEASSAHGCGEFSIGRFCGVVELLDKWPLTTLKDAIDPNATEDLYAAVLEAARPVLQKAENATTMLEDKAFMQELNCRIRGHLDHCKQEKEKRDKGNSKGTHSKSDGIRKRQPKKVQAGDVLDAMGGTGGVRIEYYDAGTLTPPGEVHPPRIILNKGNPAVARFRNEQNIDATLVLALALLSDAQCMKSLTGQTPWMWRSEAQRFDEMLGEMLASDMLVDGRPLRAVK